ncbi:MAG TPA: hypothetical protein VHW64_01090 [Nocardioides sp.]|nr:hypothetical protein [Nocardioides sp.]HEX3929267.1 hypothetical protein [Nocardioides sp.]
MPPRRTRFAAFDTSGPTTFLWQVCRIGEQTFVVRVEAATGVAKS